MENIDRTLYILYNSTSESEINQAAEQNFGAAAQLKYMDAIKPPRHNTLPTVAVGS